MIYHRAACEDMDDCYIIEMALDGVADLFTRLRRYRLRRPIDIAVIDDLQLWICWGGDADTGSDLTDRGFADPRHPTLGLRWFGPMDAKPPFAEIGVAGDVSDWHLRRILPAFRRGQWTSRLSEHSCLRPVLMRLARSIFKKAAM